MKIDLELFNHKHILKTYEWVSNLELRKQFLIRGDVTWEKHIEYFERALNDPTQRIYAILADGSHVGNCGFKNIKPSQKEGEVWIYIGESVMQRKGIGARAVEFWWQDGFEAVKL